jgi:hypothetical protein
MYSYNKAVKKIDFAFSPPDKSIGCDPDLREIGIFLQPQRPASSARVALSRVGMDAAVIPRS